MYKFYKLISNDLAVYTDDRGMIHVILHKTGKEPFDFAMNDHEWNELKKYIEFHGGYET